MGRTEYGHRFKNLEIKQVNNGYIVEYAHYTEIYKNLDEVMTRILWLYGDNSVRKMITDAEEKQQKKLEEELKKIETLPRPAKSEEEKEIDTKTLPRAVPSSFLQKLGLRPAS